MHSATSPTGMMSFTTTYAPRMTARSSCANGRNRSEKNCASHEIVRGKAQQSWQNLAHLLAQALSPCRREAPALLRPHRWLTAFLFSPSLHPSANQEIIALGQPGP